MCVPTAAATSPPPPAASPALPFPLAAAPAALVAMIVRFLNQIGARLWRRSRNVETIIRIGQGAETAWERGEREEQVQLNNLFAKTNLH